MYEKLVKRLVDFAAETRRDEDAKLAFEAADAIEELSKPRWIPVTERLPEDDTLVGKLIADSEGNIRIAGRCAEITLNGGKTVFTDLVDLVDFLAGETPTTEWDDCTHITHWMPLPEPAKEEA